MKPNIKKDKNGLLKVEKSLYNLKMYIKDTFLAIIDKIDDLESKINQFKSEKISRKNIKEDDTNKSLLGDYIASGSYSNRKSKNESTDSLEPQAKKKKVRGKNDTQILTDSLKKMSQENYNKNEELSKNDKDKREDEFNNNNEDKLNKNNEDELNNKNKEINDEQKKSDKNVSKEVTSNNADISSLITSDFSYKGKHTERTYDLLKMKERFFKKFGDNWFTVPQCTKLFFNSKKKPPMDEWMSALNCMFEKKMLDRNEGVKLKYKVIE